jgi:general secretion pathway protein G
MYRGNKKTGFTLVEILIVVIILGILAAIVIPQFTNASTEARWSSTASLLQTLRSQIELYKLQHGDELPDLVTDWTPLTGTTTFGANTYGPYMQQTPKNPMNGFNVVMDGTTGAGPSGTQGWIYDYNAGAGTGKIWATNNTAASSPADCVFNEDNPADTTLAVIP